MRVIFSANWIFQGWITHLVLALCSQAGLAINCLQGEYEYNRTCCSKCEPGKYVFEHCTGSSHTMCRDCGSDEYQPDWNSETKCIPQKFCDEGKGFYRTRPHNPIAAEPCRCKQGFHCSLINCEYCEAIKKCPAGEGVLIHENGRASCVSCQYGFFSESLSIEACKKWTDCKAIGKTEKQPGSSKTDVVCGHSPGPMTPWVVVAILSVIIVVSLVVLFLFRCKNKLNFLSVNLRTCVQNLKRSRNQQETVIPSYHCSNGPQTCPLICQEKTPPESLIMYPSTTLTITDETSNCKDREQDQDQADTSSGSSGEDSGDGPASPLTGSSCSCAFSKEPMEVGENEDCSQLVATGLATCLSCKTGDAFDTKGENVQVINLKEPLLCENCSSEGLPACAGCADSLTFFLCLAGQVTGNNNTTFISSGQVMNFSGEVIVVYVSQTSLGSGGGTEEPFSCPVQEESNEDSFQNEPKSNKGTAPQGKNGDIHCKRHLPVQEVTNDWSCQK
ncbi:tumor necrosis factor receptor superfamily member 11A-like [Xyrauchen texanus]|uniref:tumor necrosis factor receptor superfamily member 11A-like n=1 Tax=Xyrauchen texanus TaxID=154827 RepID=UPI002241F40C|nr:tumor necrosis factor receptor superfamily member 11A-like [Xyrauchen texanus]